MAKSGGTLTANTNAEVLAANMTRTVLCVINASTTDTIYCEFGAAASTTAADDSWIINPQGAIMLNVGEWPEITGSVNLKSTGTPSYVARDNASA